MYKGGLSRGQFWIVPTHDTGCTFFFYIGFGGLQVLQSRALSCVPLPPVQNNKLQQQQLLRSTHKREPLERQL